MHSKIDLAATASLLANQNHVSVRKLFRLQKNPWLLSCSHFCNKEVLLTVIPKSSVNITEEDIPGCKSPTDTIASDAGYSAHATVKKLACASGYSTLVYDGRDIGVEDLQDDFQLD